MKLTHKLLQYLNIQIIDDEQDHTLSKKREILQELHD